ncbi:TetR/AcrR family transcriptional regulator [Streptomyces sp. NPDC058440]|uniref:TetR/AcrR family transcriptional regulator n=1 Tax=Streptomyces sp. NPDC058440 TaxID=3346501 RepID=UPI0036604DC9
MSATPWYIKAVLRLALPAACLAALYLSIPGEIALAQSAGWTEHYAPAMPICLSVYALAAGAIATFRRKAKLPGQNTALVGALMALLLAMSAQSISHLIEQTYMAGSWWLTVAVSCIPPLVIGHLIHMAETPSQALSASEELEQARGMVDHLLTELVGAESRSILSHASSVLVAAEGAVQTTESLTKWATKENGRWDEHLGEIEQGIKAGTIKPPRKRLALTRDRIEDTRKALAAKGEKVTVEAICKALGVSQATYYRHTATA